MISTRWFAVVVVSCVAVLATTGAALAGGSFHTLNIRVLDEAGTVVPDTMVSVGDPEVGSAKAATLPDGTHYAECDAPKIWLDVVCPGLPDAYLEMPLPDRQDLGIDITVDSQTGAATYEIVPMPGDGDGPGPPECQPGAGDCFIPNGTPGCDDPVCCALICGIDPFCCTTEWDQLCADQAAAMCNFAGPVACCFVDGSCQDLTTDECLAASGVPGVGGTSCATVMCPQPPGQNDECEGALPIGALPTTVSGTTVGQGNDDVPFCGTSNGAGGGVWYTLVGTGNTITLSTCENSCVGCSADFDTKIRVYCQGCDVLNCVAGNDDEPGCNFRSTVTFCSQAGVEYLVLMHGFGSAEGNFTMSAVDDGAACSPDVECISAGACCVASTCVLVSEAECTGQGGTYLGDDTTCAGTYIVETCDEPFTSISATGTLAPTASNVDDGGDVVDIGFSFPFFMSGTTHTQIGITSNGYLTFGNDLSDFTNDPIPSTIDPNDFIAPLWEDWSPNNGGDVYYETQASPTRFVASWEGVPPFGGGAPSDFQAILYPSGAIELIRGSYDVGQSPTCGIENADGTDGIATSCDQDSCTRLVPQPSECGALARPSTSEKGSLLLFSKVDIRWDDAGGLLQDTFLSLTNDYPTDVHVQMYFVNGDPPLEAAGGERAHPGWNKVDNGVLLTGDQPTYWSALSGLPGPSGGGLAPFTVLDPGFPPGRPSPEGGRMLRGFVVAWAVAADSEEIRWNHLSGAGTIVNYAEGSAWEYGATAYAAVADVGLGGKTGTPGVLNLDGAEYAHSFDLLLMNFQAVGSSAFSGPRQVLLDTDITLHPVTADLRQETDGPITTKANFDIWNMNEVKFSGQHRCVTCWDETLASAYGAPGHFGINHLQTNAGKARIDGIGSQVCDVDYDGNGVCGNHPLDMCAVDAALTGLTTRLLSFDGGVDHGAASAAMVGMGADVTAFISYDLTLPPPEGQMPSDPDAVLRWLQRKLGISLDHLRK
ncbi:MAG: nidogen-like domain-containing protein [Planctomycetota bacterium]|jgi:hypothetical protein